MHKYVTTNAESTTKIPENRAGKTSVLRINLHSLQVHMRTAMHAAMHLEEILPDGDKKFELPENFINVQRHLESGLDCWEQVNKELSTFQESERSDEKKEHPVQPSTTREEEPVVHDIMDEEIPLEDQIFEGMADDSDDQSINDDDSFDLRPRKLVEDTATVMQELRSVLAVKTSEKEREMWKMKLFPGYKGKKVEKEKKATV
uniref:Uncharacterized protein n=1 Tax=Ciona savignyi TaxID=51511 RepID=H2ZP96_CIOSA